MSNNLTETLNEYFLWLCERSNMASPFLFLARTLFQRQFSAVVPKDMNRIVDGRELRMKFTDEVKHPKNAEERNRILDELYTPDCRMLELLIGIAERLNSMYQDSPYDKGIGEWMHELLSNLQLVYMTDSVLTEYPEYLQEAGKIMNKLTERTFDANGFGGMFPLKSPPKDQRTAEIWDQMMAYCMENYNIAV